MSSTQPPAEVRSGTPAPLAETGVPAPVQALTIDDRTPLCEQCGYPILLDPEHAGEDRCPECGTPREASLPARRVGSPWQRGAGWRAWWETGLRAVARPGALFDRVAIHPRRGRGLYILNLLLASGLLVAPWVGNLVSDPARMARGSGTLVVAGMHALMFVLELAFVMGVLALLTWIEWLGIRFFARQRGWRLTRAGAWQVCYHASYGWVLAGLLPMLGMALDFTLVVLFDFSPRGVLDLSPVLPTVISWHTIYQATLVLGGLVLGLFCFELLVYRGVRRVRFAATVDRLPD